MTPEEITERLAQAWDDGWRTAAGCYWFKPRNPYSGEMNESDPDDYCPAHGGTGTVMECMANWLPWGQPCPGTDRP